MAKNRESRELTRRDPFAELDPFGRFSPLFERGLLGSPLSRLLDEFWSERGRLGVGVSPAVDIMEDENQYVLTMELPGGQREDVHVELQEGVLTIRGEKKSEREEKKENRRIVERAYGSFSRSFTLPRDADGDRIEASFKEGVLTITIPKTPEVKPRTVAIGPG
jgi:HSP20 family protein